LYVREIMNYWNYALVNNNDKDLWFSQSTNLSAIETLGKMFSDCHIEKWYWRRGKFSDILYLKETLEGKTLWRE